MMNGKKHTFSEETHYVGRSSDTGTIVDEVWRDIPGYEGSYQASSLGRIRSVDRIITTKDGRRRTVSGKILKPTSTKTRPYWALNLGKTTPCPIEVHRLVALTFHGPCPDGCEVMHLNGACHDNRPENLEYGSHSENVHDVYHQGKKIRKLTKEDVYQIRFGLHCGIKVPELAMMYNIDPCNVYRLRKGVTFSYL